MGKREALLAAARLICNCHLSNPCTPHLQPGEEGIWHGLNEAACQACLRVYARVLVPFMPRRWVMGCIGLL